MKLEKKKKCRMSQTLSLIVSAFKLHLFTSIDHEFNSKTVSYSSRSQVERTNFGKITAFKHTKPYRIKEGNLG